VYEKNQTYRIIVAIHFPVFVSLCNVEFKKKNETWQRDANIK
jgi:hypothetical protein